MHMYRLPEPAARSSAQCAGRAARGGNTDHKITSAGNSSLLLLGIFLVSALGERCWATRVGKDVLAATERADRSFSGQLGKQLPDVRARHTKFGTQLCRRQR